METRFVQCTECGGDHLWHGKEGYLKNPKPAANGTMPCPACNDGGNIVERAKDRLISTTWPELAEAGTMSKNLIKDKIDRLNAAWNEKYRVEVGEESDGESVLQELKAINRRLERLIQKMEVY